MLHTQFVFLLSISGTFVVLPGINIFFRDRGKLIKILFIHTAECKPNKNKTQPKCYSLHFINMSKSRVHTKYTEPLGSKNRAKSNDINHVEI